MYSPNIGINEFVKRQTKDSPYGYYNGPFKNLIKLAKKHYNSSIRVQGSEGIPRVILIAVNPKNFYTSVVEVSKKSNLNLITRLEHRRDNEEPYIKTVALGAKKRPAKFVNLVLYSHAALAENNEQSTDCDWEIVSINASLIENEPMHPITMARNFLSKTGGTTANYTAKEFAEAIWYWKNKITVE